ncbi:MAG: prepilin-type N-terminal cleavage/methylation domain-containing protein [Opitutales bacterium]|nr:prepilin-type N-terminal cleavage/methylation domain-containing protein [Opitutales bacterium]
MKKARGFSMIEVLLALCIGGLVLTAASSLLVTISRAWAERPATRDAFDAHVNGVAHFLSAVLEEATLPTLNQSGDDLIDLERPVGFSDSEDPLIHFYLREGPPILFWPTGSASRAHCYFQFEEGEGLSFLWFSELQELEKNDDGKMELEDEGALFKTPISPFCDEIFYCYYGEEDATADDIKEWEILDNLEENIQSGKYRIPDFIKLVFKWEEESLERTITLPVKRISPSGIEEEPF